MPAIGEALYEKFLNLQEKNHTYMNKFYRMKELLERELEIEEMFEEVANDDDFMMVQGFYSV